jgi:hypothetical protein
MHHKEKNAMPCLNANHLSISNVIFYEQKECASYVCNNNSRQESTTTQHSFYQAMGKELAA